MWHWAYQLTEHFSRTFSLPVKEESNIRSAVNLEAEQYIPAPLDSLYLDYRIINRTKDELSVLMCAAPKKMIDSMLDATKQCGLEVAIIEPNISAIARLLKRTEEGMLPTVIRRHRHVNYRYRNSRF